MTPKEAQLSPCRYSKELLKIHLKGIIEEGEFIHSWYIDEDDYLHLTIYNEETIGYNKEDNK